MLQKWEKEFPGRTETMFSAIQNVVPSHLADTKLFDFKGLKQSPAAFDRLNIISL
jgi:tRNA 2-thiocytidine biosynthesis protein TtcA